MKKSALITLCIMTLILLITLPPSVNAQETDTVSLDIPAGAMAGPDFDVDTATEAYINR